jgi:hypothetical protein
MRPRQCSAAGPRSFSCPKASSAGGTHVMPQDAPNSTSDLLTLTEAAALLRAPVATLPYWRHLGRDCPGFG